jgi:hypothetical protein
MGIWLASRIHRLVEGRWFSLGTPVSSTNKTDHHDIAEILSKVALNTIAIATLWLAYLSLVPTLNQYDIEEFYDNSITE